MIAALALIGQWLQGATSVPGFAYPHGVDVELSVLATDEARRVQVARTDDGAVVCWWLQRIEYDKPGTRA